MIKAAYEPVKETDFQNAIRIKRQMTITMPQLSKID